MEKALTKVNSLKVGSLWISKKAKEEISNISDDITVSTDFSVYSCTPFFLFWFAFGHDLGNVGLKRVYSVHADLAFLICKYGWDEI